MILENWVLFFYFSKREFKELVVNWYFIIGSEYIIFIEGLNGNF